MQQNINGGPSRPTTHILQQAVSNEGIGMPYPQANISSNHSALANILPTLTLALESLHDTTADRFERLEGLLATVRESARADSLKLAEWLDKSHERQMKATMLVLERQKAMERTIGDVKSLNGDETLTARMQRIDCALTELLEQVSDPEAAYSITPRPGVGASTIAPIRHITDRGVSPFPRSLVDRGVDPRPPDLVHVGVTAHEHDPILVDVATSTTRPVTADAGIGTVARSTAEVAVATQAIRVVDIGVRSPALQYVDAGTHVLEQNEDHMPHSRVQSLRAFGPATHLHTRFPTSPFESDPLAPAQWSPERSNSDIRGSDSPRSVLSYFSPDNVAERAQALPSLSTSMVEVNRLLEVNAERESTLIPPLKDFDHYDQTKDDIIVAGDSEFTPKAGPPPHTGVTSLDFDEGPTGETSVAAAASILPRASTEAISYLPRGVSASPISIVHPASVSSTTVVNSPDDANVSPTAEKNLASLTTSRWLPLPRRRTHQPARSESLSSLSSLSVSQSSQGATARPQWGESTSPGLPLPPSPPLPRRKPRNNLLSTRQLPSSGPDRERGRARNRSLEPVRIRESSSPDIQIIGRPEAFNSRISSLSKNRSRDGEKSKSRNRQGKGKGKTRDRDQGWDSGRPQKRRKTDDTLSHTHAKQGKKIIHANQSSGVKGKSKGKRMALEFPESSPGPQTAPPKENKKEKKRQIANDVECVWPDVITGDAAYQREYISCDNCDGWFHYACVGLHKDDLRLKDKDSTFFCPPCEVAKDKCKGRHSKAQDTAECARPNCGVDESSEWFIERIIGRMPSRTQPGAGNLPKFLWLVKWDGFSAGQSTWEFPENLGDCSHFITEFEVAAELEGKDLSDLHIPTVLNEAAQVGWG